MSKICDFIKEDAKMFFLATAEGQQPKVRPLGFCQDADGKILFAIGSQKEVYQQLLKNPLCEIVAVGTHGKWLRYTGKAVFETDPKYAELPFEEAPQLRKFYEKLKAKPMMFHLEDAKAEFRGSAGNVIETLDV